MSEDEVRMTLGDHLEELRRRLIRVVGGAAVGMVVAFVFLDYVKMALAWPLGVATAMNPPNLYTRGLPEGFNITVRLGIYVGLIVSSPYGLWQLWKFVAAGLYPNERRFVYKCIFPSVVLFLLGVAFFFILISPLMVRWFLLFTQQTSPPPPRWGPEGFYTWVSGQAPSTAPASGPFVQPLLDLGDYYSFMTLMSLAFGLAFQVPLVVYALIRTGLVDAGTFRRGRRYVAVLAVVAAAIITPTGDAFTMLAMALPMYLLYELGLFVGGRRRHKEPAG